MSPFYFIKPGDESHGTALSARLPQSCLPYSRSGLTVLPAHPDRRLWRPRSPAHRCECCTFTETGLSQQKVLPGTKPERTHIRVTTFLYRQLALPASRSVRQHFSACNVRRYVTAYWMTSDKAMFGVKLGDVFKVSFPCTSHQPVAFCMIHSLLLLPVKACCCFNYWYYRQVGPDLSTFVFIKDKDQPVPFAKPCLMALSVASRLIFVQIRARTLFYAECAHLCGRDSPILHRMAELLKKFI